MLLNNYRHRGWSDTTGTPVSFPSYRVYVFYELVVTTLVFTIKEHREAHDIYSKWFTELLLNPNPLSCLPCHRSSCLRSQTS